MTTPALTILDRAADCFNSARKNVYEGAALLYKIDTERLWEVKYDSLGQFVEEECQLSQGYASKLLQAWKFYVIDGGLSQAKLANVDAEKLYLALKLPTGTPEKRLLQAQTLSRQELRAELAEDENGNDCDHPKTVRICTTCNKRLE